MSNRKMPPHWDSSQRQPGQRLLQQQFHRPGVMQSKVAAAPQVRQPPVPPPAYRPPQQKIVQPKMTGTASAHCLPKTAPASRPNPRPLQPKPPQHLQAVVQTKPSKPPPSRMLNAPSPPGTNVPRAVVSAQRPGQSVAQTKQASTPARHPGRPAGLALQQKPDAARLHNASKQTTQHALSGRARGLAISPTPATGSASQRVALNLQNQVVQRAMEQPSKQNRPRFINAARRRPAREKKAKWLRLWEAKSQLIEDAEYDISDALKLEKELKKYDMLEYLDDYLKLAKIKELSIDQLLPMIYVASTTKKRKYPYPFPSAEDFEKFKNHIKQLVGILQINYTDLRIQGSALRKTRPGDVDIGIMVDDTEFNRIHTLLLNNLIPPQNHTRAIGQLRRAKLSGKFSPRDLALLGQVVTGQLVKVFEITKRAMRKASGHLPPLDVQLSVIRLHSSMDSSPYMSF